MLKPAQQQAQRGFMRGAGWQLRHFEGDPGTVFRFEPDAVADAGELAAAQQRRSAGFLVLAVQRELQARRPGVDHEDHLPHGLAPVR